MPGIQLKITTHVDRQKNTRHSKKKNQPIKNDAEFNVRISTKGH